MSGEDATPESALESIGGVGRHKHYSRFYRDRVTHILAHNATES